MAERSVLYDIAMEDRSRRKEYPDSTPIEVPIGYDTPLPLREEMRRFIKQELSAAAESAGEETFEEADDFDIDEEETLSPYELTDLQEEFVDDEPEEVRPKEGVENTEGVVPKDGEVEPLEKAAKPEE